MPRKPPPRALIEQRLNSSQGLLASSLIELSLSPRIGMMSRRARTTSVF
jgi:hypothetical protein